MALFNTLKNNVLNTLLGTGASLLGSTIEIGLSTTTPTNAGGNISEPSGNAYARVSMANDNAHWVASVGSKSNTSAIVFPIASGNWGTITHWIIYSASQPVIWGVLDNGSGSPLPRVITSGDQCRFLANQLRITMD
jgi:hypothetical protein